MSPLGRARRAELVSWRTRDERECGASNAASSCVPRLCRRRASGYELAQCRRGIPLVSVLTHRQPRRPITAMLKDLVFAMVPAQALYALAER